MSDFCTQTDQCFVKLLQAHNNHVPSLFSELMQFVRTRTNFERQVNMQPMQQLIDQWNVQISTKPAQSVISESATTNTSRAWITFDNPSPTRLSKNTISSTFECCNKTNQPKCIQQSSKSNFESSCQWSPGFNSPDSFNGARVHWPDGRLKYCWSQTHEELELLVPVEASVRRASQIRVFIRTHDLTILINSSGSWQHRLDGPLRHAIKPKASYWTLEPSNNLYVQLEKTEPRWWTSLLENETQLKQEHLQPQIRLDELDSTAQQTVHKLLQQQHDKHCSSNKYAESYYL